MFNEVYFTSCVYFDVTQGKKPVPGSYGLFFLVSNRASMYMQVKVGPDIERNCRLLHEIQPQSVKALIHSNVGRSEEKMVPSTDGTSAESKLLYATMGAANNTVAYFLVLTRRLYITRSYTYILARTLRQQAPRFYTQFV